MPERGHGLGIRTTDSGVEVFREGTNQLVVRQNAQTDHRPFIHPIVPPGGSVPITEDEPSHHPWQHGLFVGLNDVNGYGFWTEGRVSDRAGEDGTFHPRLLGAAVASDDTATWAVETEYRDPTGGVLLTEQQRWQLTDHGDRLDMDVIWSLTAVVPVRFGEYEYGGLFLRMPFREATGGTVVNSEDAHGEASEGAQARWVSLRMPVEGDQDDAFVVIMDHPRNFRHPVPWRVDGQLGVAPSVCIAGEWALAQGATQTFRHRVSVFDRPASHDEVDRVDDLQHRVQPSFRSDSMKTVIVTTPRFDAIWPFAADRMHELLKPIASVELVRDEHVRQLSAAEFDRTGVRRLIALGIEVVDSDFDALPELEEVVVTGAHEPGSPALEAAAGARGVRWVRHRSEGFWAQSVSEFGLGLTIDALRRISQTHHAIVAGDPDSWNFFGESQYSDDSRFTNGTLHGKRVRIVGAGNIASSYASFAHALGADVAAWDPYAADSAFHRSGARREHVLERLIQDAEIFVPMVPLTPETEGLLTASHIRSLPIGCLVVQVTRARIVDTEELRRRVVADQLSLAADVFDIEPLPAGDPLIGRHNVTHTPHIAGRTKESNYTWAQMLVEQFAEFDWRAVPSPQPQRRE